MEYDLDERSLASVSSSQLQWQACRRNRQVHDRLLRGPEYERQRDFISSHGHHQHCVRQRSDHHRGEDGVRAAASSLQYLAPDQRDQLGAREYSRSGVDWSNAPDFANGKMPTQLGPIPINGMPGFVYWYCSAATNPAIKSTSWRRCCLRELKGRRRVPHQ